MGADIKEIDYDQIIVKASQIASAANDMQTAVKAAFQKIDTMRENWFGNSYDNFINVVNMSIPGLNKIFEVTVSDIPHEIAAKAKSYAASNQSSTSSSLTEQIALILNDVSKTNKGAKLRFRTANVQADQKSIESKFKEAKSAAEKASSTASSLESVWDSISGDSNIRELKAAFKRLDIILDSLGSALDNQITAQTNTIELLEGAANTVEAAGDVMSDAVDAAKDLGTQAINKIQETASDVWTNLTGKN